MSKFSIFIPIFYSSVDLSDEWKGKGNDRKKLYVYVYV